MSKLSEQVGGMGDPVPGVQTNSSIAYRLTS